MSDMLYWIWLANACGAGSSVPDLLFDHFGEDARTIYELPREELALLGLSETVLSALSDKRLTEAQEIEHYCRTHNIGLLSLGDELYPARLRAIRTKPVLLYYRGTLPPFDDSVCIATVGTRRMTEYGKRNAYLISYDLAKGGAIVVSGMASGIDGICHRGCLDAGGHTVAVLGCGIDRAYPAEHRALMDEIILHGTVISEFRPFTPPVGTNFPIRNRIISGLSQGTLVVEADRRSGAMITAKCALLQGRDVFSLPGKVGEQNSVGTNQLIRDGGKMVSHAVDILEEYEYLYPHRIHIAAIPKFRPKFTVSPLSGERRPEMQTEEQYDRRRDSLPKVGVQTERTATSSTAASAARTERTARTERDARRSNAPSHPAMAAPSDSATASSASEARAEASAEKRVDPLVWKGLSSLEQEIYGLLSAGEAKSADLLVRSANRPVSEVMVALTMLEIKGLASALPGGTFLRK